MAQEIMTGSALAVRHCACSKARSIRSNKNKFEMLEQRSEILSCYRRLDFFFKSSHQCLLPETEHEFTLPR